MRPFVLNQRHFRLASALALATILATLPGSAVARAGCTYSFGFATLHAQIPDIVGPCADAEQIDPATGNIMQRTEKGVLTWRKADNWTAFSDGQTTYVLGPDGIVTVPASGPPAATAPATAPWPAVAPGGQPAVAGRGVVLRSDTFDDPASATCQTIVARPPSSYSLACLEQELRMWGPVEPSRGHNLWLPGLFRNASLSVDIRLAGGAEGRSLSFNCRRSEEGGAFGYYLWMSPNLQRFSMGRGGESGWETVVPMTESSAIAPGDAANRVELACGGDAIAAWINGVEVGSFRDDSFKAGRFVLTAWNDMRLPLPIDVRLDNVVIHER